MNWASWADFWDMGGRAFYVWGSYGLALLLMVGELVILSKSRRTLLQRLSLMQNVAAEEETDETKA
ncbi:MAG: heme exporter protein CcmD [Pseudomonadota bacterium]